MLSNNDTATDALWNQTPRQLKGSIDTRAAIRVLDLFVQLGAWTYHEDVALLRSGSPPFSHEELTVANQTATNANPRDPDDLLSIRRDLTHLKVYTIDNRM